MWTGGPARASIGRMQSVALLLAVVAQAPAQAPAQTPGLPPAEMAAHDEAAAPAAPVEPDAPVAGGTPAGPPRCASAVPEPPRAQALEQAKEDIIGGRDGPARERLQWLYFGSVCVDDATVAARALLDVVERAAEVPAGQGVAGTLAGDGDFRPSDGYRLREGREMAALYTLAIGYGLLTDAWFLETFGVHDTGQNIGGIGLLTVGGAVAGAYLLDRGEGLRWGVPTGIFAGGIAAVVGSAYASGWYNAQARYDQELEGEEILQIHWFAATAGALAGGLGAWRHELTPGQATAFPVLQAWSSLLAMGVVGAITPDGSQADDHYSFAGLLGSVGGLAWAGWFVSEGIEPDDGRLGFINLGGVGGLVSGILVALALGVDDRQGLFSTFTTTGATGLGLATWLTRDMRETKGRRNSRVTIAPTPVPGGLGVGGTF